MKSTTKNQGPSPTQTNICPSAQHLCYRKRTAATSSVSNNNKGSAMDHPTAWFQRNSVVPEHPPHLPPSVAAAPAFTVPSSQSCMQ